MAKTTKTTECSEPARQATVEDVDSLYVHVDGVLRNSRAKALEEGDEDGVSTLGFIHLGVQAAHILLSCLASIAESQRTIAAESQMAMKDLAGEDDAPSDWRDQTL